MTDNYAGLHISTDHGRTWFTSNEGITAQFGATGDGIPVFCATVDPLDPNIIWAGTDKSGHIYKSTDRGYTWVKKTNGIDPELMPKLSFRGFTVDPRTSDTVYAMAEIGSPGWTPDGSARMGLSLDMTQGIVYKTTDGGEHWTQIWRGDNLARYCWIDPRNPDVLYVSTGIFDREAANCDPATNQPGGVGILKSTDGGQTWRVLNQANGLLDLYVGSLYMNPADPDVLLAAASQNDWSGRGATFTGGVYLTEDGWEHWQQVLQGELFSVVEFCTANPQVAYAASPKAFYRSDDGGHTWQRFSRSDNRWGPPGIIAGFPIDLQCDPDDTSAVFVNNYLGGNFLSTDGGQTWTNASQGYTGAHVGHIEASLQDPAIVYAGARSGVFRSQDGGQTWEGMAYPSPEMGAAALNEIIALALDPADDRHLLAAPADLGRLIESRDGGKSWQIASGLEGRTLALAFAPSDTRTVYAAAAKGPCDVPPAPPGTCDESSVGLYVSRNGGSTWAAISGEQTRGQPVSAPAVDPHDALKVYAGLYRGGMLKTADGGATWTSAGQGLPALSVYAVAIDPRQPDTIFAGAYGGGVYRTSDGGNTWTAASAGLGPNAGILALAVDPQGGRVVYAADRMSGAYVSTDGGQSWQALTAGMANREVVALSLSADGTVLYAGVWGDGAYRLGTPAVAPISLLSPTPAAPATQAPNPASPTAAAQPTPAPAPRKGPCPAAIALPLAAVGLGGGLHLWPRAGRRRQGRRPA